MVNNTFPTLIPILIPSLSKTIAFLFCVLEGSKDICDIVSPLKEFPIYLLRVEGETRAPAIITQARVAPVTLYCTPESLGDLVKMQV